METAGTRRSQRSPPMTYASPRTKVKLDSREPRAIAVERGWHARSTGVRDAGVPTLVPRLDDQSIGALARVSATSVTSTRKRLNGSPGRAGSRSRSFLD